jgi:outer membrane protein assembly factor BamB
VYYTPGGPETMTIALDKTNGELIWKSESLNAGAAYVSPILIEYEGKKMIINVSLRHVFAVDANTGQIMWKIKHSETSDPAKSKKEADDENLIKCVTPLYHDGKIYVTGGYNDGPMKCLMSIMEELSWWMDIFMVQTGSAMEMATGAALSGAPAGGCGKNTGRTKDP